MIMYITTQFSTLNFAPARTGISLPRPSGGRVLAVASIHRDADSLMAEATWERGTA